MNIEGTNLYKEFATSKVHIGMGLGLVTAFATANPLLLMISAAAYAIGWIFLPTSGPFVKRITDRLKLQQEVAEQDELSEFQRKRDELRYRLSAINEQKYSALSNTCAEVSGNNQDSALINGKLQELLWTYLKMLLMQQGIEGYISETNEKEIDQSIADVKKELSMLTSDQLRLKGSKESLMQTLSQHKKTLTEAKENLLILSSELTRLEHEIQLLRADAIANRNSEFLSAKIDASVESLQESKAIMQAMSNGEELSLDMPVQAANLGFEVTPKRLISAEDATRRRSKVKA